MLHRYIIRKGNQNSEQYRKLKNFLNLHSPVDSWETATHVEKVFNFQGDLFKFSTTTDTYSLTEVEEVAAYREKRDKALEIKSQLTSEPKSTETQEYAYLVNELLYPLLSLDEWLDGESEWEIWHRQVLTDGTNYYMFSRTINQDDVCYTLEEVEPYEKTVTHYRKVKK